MNIRYPIYEGVYRILTHKRAQGEYQEHTGKPGTAQTGIRRS